MVQIKHILASTLLGWYLMTPVLHSVQDVSPPISQWFTLGVVDSADECEDDQAKLKQMLKPGSTDAQKEELNRMECIATDDPRLAKQQ